MGWWLVAGGEGGEAGCVIPMVYRNITENFTSRRNSLRRSVPEATPAKTVKKR